MLNLPHVDFLCPHVHKFILACTNPTYKRCTYRYTHRQEAWCSGKLEEARREEDGDEEKGV